MEVGITLLVVALFGVWLVMRSKKWKTLLTATGPETEQINVIYEHLKSNHVKCKLVTDASTRPAGFVQASEIFPGDSGAVTKLKVHEKDMDQAKELIEEFPEAV